MAQMQWMYPALGNPGISLWKMGISITTAFADADPIQVKRNVYKLKGMHLLTILKSLLNNVVDMCRTIASLLAVGTASRVVQLSQIVLK